MGGCGNTEPRRALQTVLFHENRCNSAALTWLLNKPTVGVGLLFPPSCITDLLDGVLTDMGDSIITFSVEIKLVFCSLIMIYCWELFDSVGAFQWKPIKNRDLLNFEHCHLLHFPTVKLKLIIAYTRHQRSEQLSPWISEVLIHRSILKPLGVVAINQWEDEWKRVSCVPFQANIIKAVFLWRNVI